VEIAYARAKVVTAARAAGVFAINTMYTDLDDDTGLEEDAVFARRLGFHGKAIIHPRQIEIVCRVFTPSAAEISAARRVLRAFEVARTRGDGVISVDGKMVDEAVVEQARRILSSAALPE
jgi:citrate lyase subunit beta/citryl-CoA lyase